MVRQEEVDGNRQEASQGAFEVFGAAEGGSNPDLMNAFYALSRMNYGHKCYSASNDRGETNGFKAARSFVSHLVCFAIRYLQLNLQPAVTAVFEPVVSA